MLVQSVDGQTRLSPRAGCCLAYNSGKLYLFGGSCGIQSNDTISTTWFSHVYEINLETLSWSRPEISGTHPSPREGASSVLHDNQIIFYGGSRLSINGMRVDRFPETFILDLATMKWIYPNTRNDFPARSAHTACIFQNCMYILGGNCRADGGPSPPVRDRDTDPVFVCTEAFDAAVERELRLSKACQDIVMLDLETFVWEKFANVPDAGVCPVTFHSSCLLSKYVSCNPPAANHRVYIYIAN